MRFMPSYNILKKTVLLFGVLTFFNGHSYAAKGAAKEKKGFVLKFNGFELKGLQKTNLSLRPGVVYKGSFSNIEKAPQQTTLQSIITYQKGNTTFIYPYSHKVNVSRFKTPEPPQKF